MQPNRRNSLGDLLLSLAFAATVLLAAYTFLRG